VNTDRASHHHDRRVTIVVPIYTHWSSLRECIQSLIDHANPAIFDVLLINDVGPDADEIEAGLRGMIAGRPQFRYERNPHNLGFVKTCNRAVGELDRSMNDVLLLNSDTRLTAGALEELTAVLALSDRHGLVCPRSNDATIASIPFMRREPDQTRDAERSHEVFAEISPHLPRYYLAPVAVGFCLLIRRTVIDEHGLFDEVFGAGYSEENDLCSRVNAFGFSSVIANRAFVFHVGSTSFGSEERLRLDDMNSRVVLQRYPHYSASVVSFVHHDYSGIDRFSDLLVDAARPFIAILVDLQGVQQSSADVTQRVAATLAEFAAHAPDKTRITIATRTSTLAGLDLRLLGFHIVDPDHLDDVFDLGIALSLTTSTDQIITLNRHCLRWLVFAHDGTALRSWSARADEPQRHVIASLVLRLADQIVWPSEADRDEALHSLGITGSAPASVERLPLAGGVLWKIVIQVAATQVNWADLDERHRSIRDLAIIGEAAARRSASTAIHTLKSARSYRLAQRVSRTAHIARRILRRK
jgi:GT2 family glycosyltransferase